MNVLEAVEKFTTMNDGLTFEKGTKNGYVEFISKNASVGDLDDDVRIDITYYDNEILEVDFVFDRLDGNPMTHSLIEEFNESAMFLTAYINEDNYLTIYARCVTVTDGDDAFSFLMAVFSELINKMNYLEPLAKLTV